LASRSTVDDGSDSRWVLIAALGVGVRAAGDRVLGGLLVLDVSAMSLYGQQCRCIGNAAVSEIHLAADRSRNEASVNVHRGNFFGGRDLEHETLLGRSGSAAKSEMSACAYNATRRGKLSHLLKSHFAWVVGVDVA
jgi:hypothetical protein